MKRYLMAICILLIGSFLFAQEKVSNNNILEIGLCDSFNGIGDKGGPGIFIQYSHALNDHFAISSGVLSAYAHSVRWGNYSHSSSFAGNISLRIIPLPNVKILKRFSMNIGGLYHRLINTWGKLDDISESGLSYSTIGTTYMDEKLWGLIGSVNCSLIDNAKITSGVSFDLNTSFSNNMFNCDGFQTKVFLGIKL